MISTLLAIAVLIVGAWYWFESMRARETALFWARAHCRRYGVQLLDDTVVMGWRRVQRHGGIIGWARLYVFEYATTGTARYYGYVALRGRTLLRVELQHEGMPVDETND